MAFLSFLDLRYLPVKEAEAIILPIPYEATTTYVAGTREGPEAIIAASRQLETWDEEMNWDPSQAVARATAPPLTPEVSGPQAMLEKIRRTVQPWAAHKLGLPVIVKLPAKARASASRVASRTQTWRRPSTWRVVTQAPCWSSS